MIKYFVNIIPFLFSTIFGIFCEVVIYVLKFYSCKEKKSAPFLIEITNDFLIGCSVAQRDRVRLLVEIELKTMSMK